MGIFSSIGKVAKKVVSAVNITNPKASIYSIPAVVAHPVKAIQAPFSKDVSIKGITEKFYSGSTTKQATEVIVSGATVVGALAGGGAIASASKAGKLGTIVNALIPKTLKGKIVAGVSAPIIAGAVSTNPFKVAETISEAPLNLVNFGQNLGEFGQDPSKEKAIDVFKENPYLTAGALGAGLLGSGLALGTLATGFSQWRSTSATKKQTEAIEKQTEAIIDVTKAPKEKKEKEKKEKETPTTTVLPTSTTTPTTQEKPIEQASMAPTTPTTPETQVVRVGSAVTKRRKKKAPLIQRISQRVNIAIANQNKRYISKYAHY